jgi:N-acetylglucosaminyl-diphospho-decaprenol L-rhamnosyltransferase
MTAPVTVVIATRDRSASLLRTLDRLAALPEAPPVIVVDNGSSDGSPAAVRRAHTGVGVLELGANLGAAARTAGAALADTPLVAFSDDDSWWAPGALARADELLERNPGVALLAARVLVGPEQRLDPTCAAMAASPLGAPRGGLGPPVLGFVACGAVVRRAPLLACGGFEPRFGLGGEEELLALDLAAAGWRLAYAGDVVAHHHPGTGDRARRSHTLVRNALWSAWLRRPPGAALRRSAAVLAQAGWTGPPALAEALAGLGWVSRDRHVVPAPVERAARRLG